ncbi:MAG: LytTR family transcriptional regulator [Ruminococcaceae bacterium]|nr:LytTR family transcriptional regulator [Oscillospiraceae bacterium]
MKFTLLIDPDREEEIVVYAHKRTSLIGRIEELAAEDGHELIGYGEDEIVRLAPTEVVCFLVEDGHVCALTERARYRLKMRLYQLENIYSADFLKINQSCLVNVEKIKRFDSSIGASLMVTLEGGYRDYVSRRQLRAVKERMGI